MWVRARARLHLPPCFFFYYFSPVRFAPSCFLSSSTTTIITIALLSYWILLHSITAAIFVSPLFPYFAHRVGPLKNHPDCLTGWYIHRYFPLSLHSLSSSLHLFFFFTYYIYSFLTYFRFLPVFSFWFTGLLLPPLTKLQHVYVWSYQPVTNSVGNIHCSIVTGFSRFCLQVKTFKVVHYIPGIEVFKIWFLFLLLFFWIFPIIIFIFPQQKVTHQTSTKMLQVITRLQTVHTGMQIIY